MLRWLIIGGGVHGTYLSHALVHAWGEARGRVAVLDPHPEPLHEWSRIARNLRMGFLRSLSTDHLDLDPASLLRFARTPRGRASAPLLPQRPCPSLDLFLEHARRVIARFRLHELRLQGVARGLTFHSGFVRVQTDRGTLTARRVVLASGRNDRRCVPPLAADAVRQGDEVVHALDPDLDFESLARHRRVAIVGGGMSAAHLADALCGRGVMTTIFARHGLRVQDFDADLHWGVSPRIRHRYFARSTLRGGRCGYPGTVVPELAEALAGHQQNHRLQWRHAAVDRVCRRPGGAIVEAEGMSAATFDRVILATGYHQASLPTWIRTIGQQEGSPVDDRGFPRLGDDLRWRRGLYITGYAATPALGPLAANIAGARLAAERIGMA